MRILTLVFGLFIFATAAYSQEEGARKPANPEETLAYLEPACMVLIEALSQSGVTSQATTHDLDTMCISFSDTDYSVIDPPPSFFDSLRFESIVFLPRSRKSSVNQRGYAAFRYLRGSTRDSVRIYVEWKYIPADAARRLINPSAALVTVVRRGNAWEIFDWRRLPTK